MKSDNNHIVPGTIMAADEPAQPGGMLSVTDVTYLLFRQKWKIIICSVVGLVGAIGAYFAFRPGFQSDSKIMIRYVVETRSPSGSEGNMQIRTPDTRGETVVNAEVELLQSLDLATEVVNKVGATNILKEVGGGDSVATAARVVRKGLEVQANPRSNVIGLTYQHPDARIARLVLATLIEQYRLKHRKVHQSEEVLTELREDVTKISREITETETQLRKLKNELKIVSLQDESKTYGDLVARLRMEMMDTESGLAASRATLARFTNVIQTAAAAAATNQAAANAAPTDPSSAAATNAPAAAPIPQDVIAAYQDLLGRLSVLRTRQQVALLSYTSNSIFVRGFRDQIASTTAERDRLTGMYPGLTNTVAVAPVGTERIIERALDRNQAAAQPVIAMTDVTSELAKYSALEAKYKVLTEQYDRARKEYGDITAKESEISRLERQLQISEKQYANYSTSLQEAKLNEAIDSSRMNNISVIQEASPAYSSATKTLKIVAGILFGGAGLGLVLALVSEFYVDQSVRRPRQVSEALNIPLFLSVPKIDVPATTKLLGDGSSDIGNAGDASGSGGGGGGGDEETDLRRYAEALRDRLIMHFQISELHHKPKLIGVTSCGRGAGVTTLATTLAASLSETGEGSVLYVDVNQHSRPSAHPFRLGKPVVGISNALAAESKETALVSDNLYMVSLQEPNSRKIGVLPKKLASLVPEIKASSYDYIIFDLPPVSQTSATARVAGLLDMTVVVLESEKTHQSLAKQAVELLAESNTKMVGVLNKHQRYVPQKLESDI